MTSKKIKDMERHDALMTVSIEKRNKIRFKCLGVEHVVHIPARDQKEFVSEFFRRYNPAYLDEDGVERDLPVVITNYKSNDVVTLNMKQPKFKDVYKGIPKGMRYVPNRLVTFEKSEKEWKYDQMKRLFNYYDAGTMDEAKYKSEIRKLFSR